MDSFGVLTLMGGLALFLYGMHVMGAGIEKMSGGRLEHILESLTSTPLKAVLLGAGVTAVIQSSSATTVMVVGFVNSGIIKLSQAVGIIMGANIGTTVTAWLLSLTGIEGGNFFLQLLKPSSFSPVLALIGIIFLLSAKSDQKKNAGDIMLGFAVLMYGMQAMSGAVEPLADVPEFTGILTMFRNPLLSVVAGTVLTAVIQSSSASVGILQALSVTGAFTYGSVIPLIVGQNIGACVTPLLSALGTSRGAKRAAIVPVYFKLIGAAVFLVVFYVADAVFTFPFMDETAGIVGIAVIHSAFNIFTAIVLFPFRWLLEKLAYMTIPQTEDEKKTDVFMVLDDRFLSVPAFAIERCRVLVSQMAQMSRDSFLAAMSLLTEYSEEKAEEIVRIENLVDTYDDKISAYLTKLSSENLSYQNSLQTTALLHSITDFERISDHALNVAENAKQMHEGGYEFSKKGKEEMALYRDAVTDILNRATNAFVANNQNLARTVAPLQEVIEDLYQTVKKHHTKRLRKGKCTIELGLILSDLAMDYGRVSDHSSNIAIYMMQLKDSQVQEHRYAQRLEGAESAEYMRLLQEFGERYRL